MRVILCIVWSVFVVSVSPAQYLNKKTDFTRADTLRGSNTKERSWWNVLRYDIQVQPDIDKKTIRGSTNLLFKVLKAGRTMQIDLQQPMHIDSIKNRKGRNISFIRDSTGAVYYVHLGSPLKKNTVEQLVLYYSGKPREAVTPPWDGGWIWKKDKRGRPWISVACQGLGASVWYPCKDYQGDEPDQGASLAVTVPDSLVAVANGRLTNKVSLQSLTTYTWEVKNPINSYNIVPYIGKYVRQEDSYMGEKGKLDINYWVLDYNKDSIQTHLQPEVKRMLRALEYWLGPYPFYEDGYQIVEAPHLGMEHQSAIAYGNRFLNGYLGRDLSGTGWGMKWDFIVVHESGHEWFANNITTRDIADMWVHEGITNYSETLFTEYYYGKAAGDTYVQGIRQLIRNDSPIVGPYGVNKEGSGDMYYKGGNMIHTIRTMLNNDSLFRDLMRGINRTFYHKTVTGSEIEHYFSKKTGIHLSKIFDQYLRTTQIPVLEYRIQGDSLSYRWSNCVDGFNLKIKVTWKGQHWIQPSAHWQQLNIKHAEGSDFSVDPNFYINIRAISQ